MLSYQLYEPKNYLTGPRRKVLKKPNYLDAVPKLNLLFKIAEMILI